MTHTLQNPMHMDHVGSPLGDGEGHVDALPTIVVGTYTPGAIGGKWNSGYGQGTDPRAWPYEFGEPRGSVRLSS